MEYEYNFKVNCIESGQRQSYGDSYYTYEVTSNRSEFDVKNFCMSVLKKSFEPKDKPNPFAGRLLEFKKITDNNNGSIMGKKEETYSYKVKSEYTG